MKIFFTSDLHFGHVNIIRYSHRPFDHVQQMDDTLIANLNAVVGAEDTLYFLGDFCMGVEREHWVERCRAYRERIVCRNIVLIWGNHDKRTDPGFTDLFSAAYDLHEMVLGEQRLVLCHYPLRTWNQSHHGSWHLHGHEHGQLAEDPQSLSFDVGVDCWNYRPLSWEQVQELMRWKIQGRLASEFTLNEANELCERPFPLPRSLGRRHRHPAPPS